MNVRLYVDGVLQNLPVEGIAETISTTEWTLTLHMPTDENVHHISATTEGRLHS